MRQLAGGTVETKWWGDRSAAAPVLVLLHEGLGCVALWRDVPERLAEATGCPVFACSRFGYGGSDPAPLPRPMTYMHHEAQAVLPELLAAEGIKSPVLIGHSDGGSIAAIYAGMALARTSRPGPSRPSTTSPPPAAPPRVKGLVLIAAHFFVEDLNIASIRRIKADYETGDLRARLGRYHRDPDTAFRGWNDAWLDPRFRDFDITGFLPGITAPVLALQGADDPYGTDEQLHVLKAHVTAPLTVSLIPAAKHSPHLEAKDATLAAIVNFISDIRDQTP